MFPSRFVPIGGIGSIKIICDIATKRKDHSIIEKDVIMNEVLQRRVEQEIRSQHREFISGFAQLSGCSTREQAESCWFGYTQFLTKDQRLIQEKGGLSSGQIHGAGFRDLFVDLKEE